MAVHTLFYLVQQQRHVYNNNNKVCYIVCFWYNFKESWIKHFNLCRVFFTLIMLNIK